MPISTPPTVSTVRNARDAAQLTFGTLLRQDSGDEMAAVLTAITTAAAAGRTCLTDHLIPAQLRICLVHELRELRFDAWAHLPAPEASKARLNVSWPENPEVMDG